MITALSSAIASSSDREIRDDAIYRVLGLVEPGAVAIREPDGRMMVWATEADSEDDDGARATYRSRAPITDAEWSVIQALAWIELSEAI